MSLEDDEGRLARATAKLASFVTAHRQRQAWMGHPLQSYSNSEALKLLASRSHEDVYTLLETEVTSTRKLVFGCACFGGKEHSW